MRVFKTNLGSQWKSNDYSPKKQSNLFNLYTSQCHYVIVHLHLDSLPRRTPTTACLTHPERHQPSPPFLGQNTELLVRPASIKGVSASISPSSAPVIRRAISLTCQFFADPWCESGEKDGEMEPSKQKTIEVYSIRANIRSINQLINPSIHPSIDRSIDRPNKQTNKQTKEKNKQTNKHTCVHACMCIY